MSAVESVNGPPQKGVAESSNQGTAKQPGDRSNSLESSDLNQPLKVSKLQDEERQMSPSSVHQAVKELNQGTQIANKQLHFLVHEGTHRLMVQVIDSKTQKVIKEIPPEKVLDAAARIKEFIGVLLDEKV